MLLINVHVLWIARGKRSYIVRQDGSKPAFTCSKANNKNNRTRCENMLKLTIKTSERRQWRSGVFIVNFEHIPHLALLFLLLTLNMQLPGGKELEQQTFLL